MPISLKTLLEASTRSPPTEFAKSLNEARLTGRQTAFLCHSHKDQPQAVGLQVLLAENGWDLYIDWQDTTMPSKPNKNTARKIKKKIDVADIFLILATKNSMKSRWCPWEVGYADNRPKAKIFLVRTSNDVGTLYGNEYLKLYREIRYGNDFGLKSLAVFKAGHDTGGVLLRSFRL